MKNKKKIWALFLMMSVMGISITLISCKKDNSTSITQDDQTSTLKYDELSEEELELALKSCTPGVLDQSEIDALMIMREEELLARDVYIAFNTMYSLPVFNKIAKSENTHTTAVKKLIVKYNLTDPAVNHQPGTFTNPVLQTLYTQLVAQGTNSLVDALYVGATIEDLDIFDLQHHITQDVDNADILKVFNNLLKGSKNHIRAFNALLTAHGVIYVPQYISQAEFDDIVQ